MREILFRGKRVSDEMYVTGFYYFDTNGCHYIQYPFETPDGEHGYKSHEVDPETVGQFTGLTDKNGAKIFEGDIVEAEVTVNLGSSVRRSTARYVVMYHPENCYFYLARKRNNILFDGNWNYSVDIIGVVGNIHDNPELLEVQE